MPQDTPLRLACGQLEDAISPGDATRMAGLLTKVASALCAYASSDRPAGEAMAQIHEHACPQAAT